ncbi:MAG: GvpL/GvpF family gas vesicle protein [Solirubrobacterales bacterium]|nr:GvpL/GvpF family gas vesicle protein [Solirubrobacterales bacterium]
MPRSDDSLERLRAAIDELAAIDAAELLAEARIEARARVRTSLTDALAHSMLEQLHDQLPAPVDDRPPAPARPEPRPAPTPRRSEPPGEPAWYVYGVVSSDAELDGELNGVDPAQPVTILREGALAAVTSQVPLEEFDEARLREHLADMAWVEATARAHEAVLERLCEQMTVIPMRMCTVYRTEGGVREMLHREADALQDALEHLSGRAEWGVKAFLSLSDDGPHAQPETETGQSRGAAYMERKRTQRERRQQVLATAEETANAIHDRLGTLADDDQVIPLQRPEASGHRGDMILNGVYLVADEALDHFHEGVRALQAQFEPDGIEIVPTGPWPAYNFVPGTIGAAW